MTASTHTVAALQMEPRFGDVVGNLDRVEQAIRGASFDLLVLPELFNTGYSFRDRDEAISLAEPFPDGETTQRLLRWSDDTGATIVAGYAEREGDRVFNAAAIVAGGEPLESYRKIHLFGFEQDFFDAGDRPFAVHEHAGLRVGTMICFDWVYPEAARTLALKGADVIAHPSNLVLPGWCQQAMLVRALENRVYTVTANRFGTEHREPHRQLRFTGASRIAGPDGTVLADGPEQGEMLVRADVDTTRARDKHVPSGNDLFAGRRPEWYRDLSRDEP